MTILKETMDAINQRKSAGIRERARHRLTQLTMPHWALGRLMDLAENLAHMTGTATPPVKQRTVVVMAGDHGVAAEGTSAYPQEVTVQMVHNFVANGAGINALAKVAGARVVVVDMGVAGDLSGLVTAGQIVSRRIAPGTRNMAAGPAMTREQAVAAIEAGIGVAGTLAPTTDIFGTGDMGIGNTTPSSAIVATLCNAPVERIAGRGTGIDDGQLLRKIGVIEAALRVNRPDPSDPLDVLAKVGGFEIGGIAGLILGAASLGKPVLVDGFISTAGALIAAHLAPVAKQNMISAHRSAEPGHAIALDHLGLEPLLSLEMRLGEGTGSALAMNLVASAAALLTDVATFAEAGVSTGE